MGYLIVASSQWHILHILLLDMIQQLVYLARMVWGSTFSNALRKEEWALSLLWKAEDQQDNEPLFLSIPQGQSKMVACDGDCCQWFHIQCTDYKVKKWKSGTARAVDQLNNLMIPHCLLYVYLYHKKISFSLTWRISFFKIILLYIRSCSVYMYICIVCIS